MDRMDRGLEGILQSMAHRIVEHPPRQLRLPVPQFVRRPNRSKVGGAIRHECVRAHHVPQAGILHASAGDVQQQGDEETGFFRG